MAITKRAPEIVSTSSHSSSKPVEFSGKLEWEDVNTEFTTRAVAMGVYGDTDTGRSTLALTAPGPIAYIHSYEKVDGLIQAARRLKEIKVKRFSALGTGDVEEIQALAEQQRLETEAAIRDAYSWARSIIVDTETKLWDMYQLARMGSLMREERSDSDKRKGQLIYTEINAKWSNMLQMYRTNLELAEKSGRQPTNLILISKTKDEYKKQKTSSNPNVPTATGKTIRAGQKDTAFFCDVIVRTVRDGKVFKGVIEKPWWNNAYRDAAFTSEEGILDFPNIMSMLTETDLEEWS